MLGLDSLILCNTINWLLISHMKSNFSSWVTFSPVADLNPGPLAPIANVFLFRYLDDIPDNKLLTKLTVAQVEKQGQTEL